MACFTDRSTAAAGEFQGSRCTAAFAACTAPQTDLLNGLQSHIRLGIVSQVTPPALLSPPQLPEQFSATSALGRAGQILTAAQSPSHPVSGDAPPGRPHGRALCSSSSMPPLLVHSARVVSRTRALSRGSSRASASASGSCTPTPYAHQQ